MQNINTVISVVSVAYMSIWLEVNFSPKHQLMCNYYHSNGFYLVMYLCKQQARQSFCSISLTFSLIFIFFFFDFRNQSAAGNVIQLIKKISLRLFLSIFTGIRAKYLGCFVENIYMSSTTGATYDYGHISPKVGNRQSCPYENIQSPVFSTVNDRKMQVTLQKRGKINIKSQELHEKLVFTKWPSRTGSSLVW